MQLPTPEGATYDKHQLEAIEQLIKTRPKHWFIGDKPGTGKTVTNIGYLQAINENQVLVICTKKGQSVWRNHLLKWRMPTPIITIYHPEEPFFTANVLIVQYYWLTFANLAKEIRNRFKFNTIIIDEFQNLRRGKSVRTRNIVHKNSLQAKCERVILSSGTPIFNNPIDLYVPLKSFRPDVLGNMTKQQFIDKYCVTSWDEEKNRLNFLGGKNILELSRHLHNTCMISRTAKDAGLKMPTMEEPRILFLKRSQTANDIIDELNVFGDHITISNKSHNDAKLEIATLRRFLGLEMVAPGFKYIKHVFKKRKRLLVFIYHREVLEKCVQLSKSLGHEVLVLKSGQSDSRVDTIISQFQSASKKSIILYASISNCNDTITLTAADHMIFLEISSIWEMNYQAIHRVVRRGQWKKVPIDFLAFRKTYIERLLRHNVSKRKTSIEFEKGRK